MSGNGCRASVPCSAPCPPPSGAAVPAEPFGVVFQWPNLTGRDAQTLDGAREVLTTCPPADGPTRPPGRGDPGGWIACVVPGIKGCQVGCQQDCQHTYGLAIFALQIR